MRRTTMPRTIKRSKYVAVPEYANQQPTGRWALVKVASGKGGEKAAAIGTGYDMRKAADRLNGTIGTWAR
jgi:hypothetical protein